MLVSQIAIESFPYGGATLSLRLFSRLTWTDETGKVRLRGRPGPGTPCEIFPGVVDNQAGIVTAFNFPPTVTSPDRPRVRITGVLFDSNGRQRDPLFRNWRFPSGQAQISFADLTIFNAALPRRFADRYATIDQVLAYIAGAVGAAQIKAHGIAQMVDGQVTVPLGIVTVNSRVIATGQDENVSGALRAENYVAGAGFDIVSTNGADSGQVLWMLLEN